MRKVAIFCSGSGSNAEALMAHFQNHPSIRVVFMVTNKEDAKARERADRFGIPSGFFPRKTFSSDPGPLMERLTAYQVDFILLAGFLQLLPPDLVNAYSGRILNIHPALLPAFGGAGMYGHHVHKAVRESGVTETGLTIHEVNTEYDKGKIIFQAICPVDNDDSPDDIAARVLKMEHLHYPLISEYFISQFKGEIPPSA